MRFPGVVARTRSLKREKSRFAQRRQVPLRSPRMQGIKGRLPLTRLLSSIAANSKGVKSFEVLPLQSCSREASPVQGTPRSFFIHFDDRWDRLRRCLKGNCDELCKLSSQNLREPECEFSIPAHPGRINEYSGAGTLQRDDDDQRARHDIHCARPDGYAAAHPRSPVPGCR